MRDIETTKKHLTQGQELYRKCLAAWAATVTERPTHALVTMTDTFGLAARIELADKMLALIDLGEIKEVGEPAIQAEVTKEITSRLILRGRSAANYSTNPCVNLMEDSRTEALADFADWWQLK